MPAFIFFRKELDLFYLASERAIALNPNDTFVLSAAGLFMCYPGRWERGIALLDKARKLNPYHPDWYYYAYYYNAYRQGMDSEALDFALRLNMPGFFWPHQMLAAAYAQLGMESEAKAQVNTVLELYPAYSIRTMADMHRMWNFEDTVIERMAEGLRLAGLPEEPPPSGSDAN